MLQWSEFLVHPFPRDRLTTLNSGPALEPLYIGLFGSSGAGKSTLLNTILGKRFFLPVSGTRTCTSCQVHVSVCRSKHYEAKIFLLSDEVRVYSGPCHGRVPSPMGLGTSPQKELPKLSAPCAPASPWHCGAPDGAPDSAQCPWAALGTAEQSPAPFPCNFHGDFWPWVSGHACRQEGALQPLHCCSPLLPTTEAVPAPTNWNHGAA